MTAAAISGQVMMTRSTGIATITISQPDRRNAMTADMWRELNGLLGEVARDAGVRVLVLTGAGHDFCAGMDIATTAETGPETHPLPRMQRVGRAVLSLHRLPIPTIARVDGVAIGAGCNLALGCDLIVASDRARFSEIFTRRGLSVDAGGSWLLPRLIGLHRAKELCFLAEVITAAEARELGLVNRVVSVDEIDATVDNLAKRLSAAPPIAIQQTKRLLNDGFGTTFEQALDSEVSAQSVNLQGADSAEAFRAFLDKREPCFTGGGFRIA